MSEDREVKIENSQVVKIKDLHVSDNFRFSIFDLSDDFDDFVQ